MNRPVRPILLLVLALVGLSSCAEQGDDPTVAIERRHTVGDATVLLTLDAIDVRTTDRLTLEIDVVTPPRHVVEWRPPEAGTFTLVEDSGAPPPDLVEGMLHRTRRLVLEPFLEGDYEIPAQEVTITALDGGQRETITTDPIAVTVRTVLDEADALEVAPARPVPNPEAPATSRTLLIVTGLVVISTLAALLLWWNRRPDPDRARRADLRALGRELDGASSTDRTIEVYRSIVARMYGPEALAATATEVRTERVLPEMPFASRQAFANALEWRERCYFAGAEASPPPSMRDDARALLEGVS